jgi:sugar phosphate isomerase/epimerase
MKYQPTHHSRRKFLRQATLLGSGAFLAPSLFSKEPFGIQRFKGVQIGAITYSFRSMPGTVQNLLDYCKQAGIKAIELMGDAVEIYAGSPAGEAIPKTVPDMRKALEERRQKVSAWRETVSMDAFIEVRRMFNNAGISIYAFKPDALGEKNSDAEIAYAMKAAKALGASSVTVELPKNAEHSKRLGAIASIEKVYVGYHAHTQATDTAWDVALEQSPYNSMNLDCGHYIAAGGGNTSESLLRLIESKHERITSMHIKDRQTKDHGAANLEWGKGDTPIRDILLLMKKKKYKFPATIELEYNIPAGSNAVEEVKKCAEFASRILNES